jgi:hypothetical protein
MCTMSTAPRGGNAGRVLRVLAAPAVRHCAARAVRSSRTGAAVRGYSGGYSAVRTHRNASKGRADDADVAGAEDTHEPAGVIGLHTTRRASSPRRPPRYAGGTRVCCEYQAPRRCAGRVLRVLAAPAVRHCAARAVRSSRTGAAVRGYSEGTQQCARTVMPVRVEPTTLTWPVARSEIATSPPLP